MKQFRKRKFDEIYGLYGGLMRRIAWAILRDQEQACDAVQECCIRIFKNIDYFIDDKQGDSGSLVSIIARNASIDLYRKVKKQREKEVAFEEYMLAEKERFADEVIKRDDYGGLKKYAVLLDERSADILILKYYFKFTYREIAGMLGITESNAKIRMVRAKEKLANLIAEGGAILDD